MMQAWADYLDQLKAGAVIIPINRLLSMFKFEFKTRHMCLYPFENTMEKVNSFEMLTF